MSLALELRPLPTASIAGSTDRFPVGRIFCVGRNYAAHAREMGADPDREPPFFFSKFPQALVPGGGTIPYPSKTADFHYEAELVIAIGQEGAALDVGSALGVVFGYAVGLDMTRRDLQFAARDKGRPWDMGKNFAFSAPIGEIRPALGNAHLAKESIRLTLNGETKQSASLADMIWSCAEVISSLSQFGRLLPGDLIYTGTPAGVGPVRVGDVIVASIDGLRDLQVTIGERETEYRT
jgi:fumarylpyruvate hydrolase